MTKPGYYERERGPLTAAELRVLPAGTIIVRHSHIGSDAPFQKIIHCARYDSPIRLVPGHRLGRFQEWNNLDDTTHIGHPETTRPPVAINYVFKLGEIGDVSGGKGRPAGYRKERTIARSPDWLKRGTINKPKVNTELSKPKRTTTEKPASRKDWFKQP